MRERVLVAGFMDRILVDRPVKRKPRPEQIQAMAVARANHHVQSSENKYPSNANPSTTTDRFITMPLQVQ
jgi:hypothetical protein